MADRNDPKFLIRSDHTSFVDRQKSIFQMLDVAEKEKNDRQMEIVKDDSDESDVRSNHSSLAKRIEKKQCKEMKQYQGKESIFKRPDNTPRWMKRRGIPDFKKNPHKWTKYSLGNVSQEDMSERANAAAALAFLNEINRRKEEVSESMDQGSSCSQIVFKRPKMEPQELSDKCNSPNKPHYRSSKLIMPEYVVGASKKKIKKQKSGSEHASSVKEIKLDHLSENVDDVE